MSALTIRANDPIDLQMHTIFSDGQWRPEQLLDHLAAAGFRVVAITDHDQLGHTAEIATLGAARHVHVIPAVEVTTEWAGKMADVLCFAESFTSAALADLVHATKTRQLANTRDVYRELLRRGYEFPRQTEVLREQGGDPVHPIDNANLLRAHGHVPSLAAGMALIRDAGFRSISADLGDAVAAAHASGAVALIAHPGRREPGFTLYDPALLDEVRQRIPIDGIEVRHPTHSEAQVVEYERYVRDHGWLQSAGSDSHSPLGRLPIPYPAHVARDLLERCGVHVDE